MKKLLLGCLFLMVGCGLTPGKMPKKNFDGKEEPSAAPHGSPAAKTHNIYISIDGGAMMGMIPLILLNDVEKQTGQPIYKLVKGITGTSTGAIIGALLTVPIKDGKPASAEEAMQFYRNAKKGVFSDKNLMSVINGDAPTILTPLLTKTLNETFGGTNLSSALTTFQIVSYETDPNPGIFIFDSEKAQQNSSLDVRVSDAIRATTAASILFSPATVTFNGISHTFIDAGDNSVPKADQVNDPTALLYQYVESNTRDNETATIYSLGTGFLNGPSEATQKIMKNRKGIKVVRIDPNLSDFFNKINGFLNLAGFGDIKEYQIRHLAAAAPEQLLIVNFDSLKVFTDAANRLKTSAEFQAMLADMKAVARRLGK